MNERVSEQLKKYTHNDCLFFSGDHILANKITKNPFLPLQKTLDKLKPKIHNMLVDGELIMINGEIDLSSDDLAKENLASYSVKRFLVEMDPANQSKILRALHWLNWDRQSKFCGKCGSILEEKIDVTEKKCPTCNTSIFPRFSPAVMVLIQKEDRTALLRLDPLGVVKPPTTVARHSVADLVQGRRTPHSPRNRDNADRRALPSWPSSPRQRTGRAPRRRDC